jgi:hypothetical protein
MASAKDKHGEYRAELLDADHSLDVSSSGADQPHSGQTEAAAEPWQTKVIKGLAHNMHYFTFLPLILIGVLSDVSLLLAAAVCTSLVACILLLSYCCFRCGHVKVSVTLGRPWSSAGHPLHRHTCNSPVCFGM